MNKKQLLSIALAMMGSVSAMDNDRQALNNAMGGQRDNKQALDNALANAKQSLLDAVNANPARNQAAYNIWLNSTYDTLKLEVRHVLWQELEWQEKTIDLLESNNTKLDAKLREKEAERVNEVNQLRVKLELQTRLKKAEEKEAERVNEVNQLHVKLEEKEAERVNEVNQLRAELDLQTRLKKAEERAGEMTNEVNQLRVKLEEKEAERTAQLESLQKDFEQKLVVSQQKVADLNETLEKQKQGESNSLDTVFSHEKFCEEFKKPEEQEQPVKQAKHTTDSDSIDCQNYMDC